MLGVCIVMAVIFQTYKRISGKKVYINDDIPSGRDKSKSQLEFIEIQSVTIQSKRFIRLKSQIYDLLIILSS